MKKLTHPPNLTEMTYRSIKQSILTGVVNRSFRLTEEYLATQLGISKSPVREALNRLEAEGLVRIEPRRGASVREFSAKEIRDLYDLRVVLEVHSIQMAALTPELLAELAASIARTTQILAEGDRVKHIEEDLRFHRMIAEATDNEELCRLFENVQQKTLLCRYASYELSATTSPLAHKRIYRALKQDDRPGAQEAMKEHIEYVRDRLLKNREADGALQVAGD
ncbi:GntR family transcriptional regulator [Granulicella sp. WH15]|uniref:GntR family transcriptional regulator n=1 Tax=Granulicella sp. WH15 TaxID=2602070 RepID=UPI0013668102|nr:GntR family transcriptional regulator [Granulicella sp. WH15]QHN04329.1 GntR family transcriptional regulator [Granulicella sp. WH15]